MTITQIQYFLVAAERLNFTTAAEQLYITQPSLSRQIAAIESELGVKLFARLNNVITLTPAGALLYQRLTSFYEDYQSIVKEVRSVSAGKHGHLNLGVLEDQYMDDHLIYAIRSLLQDDPECEIEISRHDSRSLFSGIMDGSIDVGLMLIYDEFSNFGFSHPELNKAPAQLAIHRALPESARSSFTLDELNRLLERIPLAMVTQNQFPEPLQDSLMKFVPFTNLEGDAKVQLLPAISSVSLYVAAGLAVTLTNQGNLLANDPNIVLIPVKGISTISQGLVWRKNARNPILNLLISRLKENYSS
jgi:DNA-binding transcriptional LysR family regulator